MAEGAQSPEAAAQAQAALLELLLGTLRRSDIVRCVNVASTCLFMYDHAVTFLDEVEFIWPAAWGPGKILFLLARYLTWPELISGLIHQFFDISGETCHNIFGYNSVSIVWGIGAAELILILRTWAIWNREKTLLIVLLVFFCAVWGPETYIIVELVKKTTFVPASSFSPVLKGCIITASSQIVTNAWILLTAFEAIILALTLIKGYQHFSQGSSHLINLLYRDGILYFVYLFAISVANLVVVYTTEAEFTILLTQLQRVLYAVLSCRIILHLKAVMANHDVQTLGNSLPYAPGRRAFSQTGRDTTLNFHVDNTTSFFGTPTMGDDYPMR